MILTVGTNTMAVLLSARGAGVLRSCLVCLRRFVVAALCLVGVTSPNEESSGQNSITTTSKVLPNLLATQFIVGLAWF